MVFRKSRHNEGQQADWKAFKDHLGLASRFALCANAPYRFKVAFSIAKVIIEIKDLCCYEPDAHRDKEVVQLHEEREASRRLGRERVRLESKEMLKLLSILP